MWSRLGAEVTVVEFLGQIGGPGMDAEISKLTQKILGKQGMKFKLNTKVLSGDPSGEGVKLEVEAAKGGKKETVSSHYEQKIQIHSYRTIARCRCCSRSYWPSALHCRLGARKHWP